MLQRDAISSQFYIHSFEDGTLKVLSTKKKKPPEQEENYDSYTSTILVSQELLRTDDLMTKFDDLNTAILDEVKEQQIEILLIGTGPSQKFPPIDFLKKTNDYPFSIDFMDTGAACRTFNILANENRRVAALLFPN